MLTITEIIQFCLLSVLMTIPIALKTVTAYIFKNIEFKTQTFRFLRINSIFDVLFMITYPFQPWTELKNEKWGNYWLTVYKFYILIYASRCLRTLNLIMNTIVAWNQYRQNKNRNKIPFSKCFFYAVISCVLIFSFVLL